MEDEMKNISAVMEYMDSNPTVNHLSRAITVFTADVYYHDDIYEDITLRKTEIQYQHSYNNEVTISALRPPYYSSFWFSHQHFEYINGKLYVTGVHHDDPSKKYKVTIG